MRKAARERRGSSAAQQGGTSDYLGVAHGLADISARAIMPYFRRRNEVVNKADGKGFDPVTAADRAAELAIREELG
ncbi:MAG: hypothetical protein F9K44_05255, partial [Hyphomicrobiaceae bacterium]